MGLIDLLKRADSYLKELDYQTAKKCLKEALVFAMDEQIKNVVYEQLSMCSINLKEPEDAMLYLELLILSDEYEDAYNASVSLAMLYRDAGRFDDMYRIGKKISTFPHPGNTLKQPEQLYYELWCSQNEPDAAELERQRNYKFKYEPKISIVVPVFNVKIEFLIEMLNSVCSQTYINWELCLADGNSTDENIRETIREYAQRDPRIKFEFLEENLGISENTNAAVMMGDGEYIFFLDHDDVLSKDALFEVAIALEDDRTLEFVYSDHDIIIRLDTGDIRTSPLFKPSWSPALFEQQNYILHPVIIKREFMQRIGLLKKEFDRAQDTELLNRITDNSNKILHIPKVLYHWRIHRESTNFTSIGGGDTDINKKVLAIKAEHLSRINVLYRGLESGSLDIIIRGNPKVSVIIVNKDNYSFLKRCIDSIRKFAGYENYEIIIVDTGSKEKDVLHYYEALYQKNVATILYRGVSDAVDPYGYASDYNYGAGKAGGEYLVFISATCEINSENWIYTLLQTQQYPNTGLTGCGINYMDESENLLYFAGMQLIGNDCGIEHLYSRPRKRVILCPDELLRKEDRPDRHNVTALDSACVIIKKKLFDSLNGFDMRFPYVFFVIDLCLKSRRENLYNVWVNGLTLNYIQNKDIYIADALKSFEAELELFKNEWQHETKKDDPFMNINFSVENYEKNGCLLNLQGEGRQ